MKKEPTPKSKPTATSKTVHDKSSELSDQELDKASGGTPTVKTVPWAHDDESPKETTTFVYGGL